MATINFGIALLSLIVAVLPYFTRLMKWSTKTATLKQLTRMSLLFGFVNTVAISLVVAITILR